MATVCLVLLEVYSIVDSFVRPVPWASEYDLSVTGCTIILAVNLVGPALALGATNGLLWAMTFNAYVRTKSAINCPAEKKTAHLHHCNLALRELEAVRQLLDAPLFQTTVLVHAIMAAGSFIMYLWLTLDVMTSIVAHTKVEAATGVFDVVIVVIGITVPAWLSLVSLNLLLAKVRSRDLLHALKLREMRDLDDNQAYNALTEPMGYTEVSWIAKYLLRNLVDERAQDHSRQLVNQARGRDINLKPWEKLYQEARELQEWARDYTLKGIPLPPATIVMFGSILISVSTFVLDYAVNKSKK